MAGPWDTRFNDPREQISTTERSVTFWSAGPSSTAAPLSLSPSAGLTKEEAEDEAYAQRISDDFEAIVSRRAGERGDLRHLPSEFGQKLIDLKDEATHEHHRQLKELSRQASNRSDLSRTYVSQSALRERNRLRREFRDKLESLAKMIPGPESTEPQHRIEGFDPPSSSHS